MQLIQQLNTLKIWYCYPGGKSYCINCMYLQQNMYAFVYIKSNQCSAICDDIMIYTSLFFLHYDNPGIIITVQWYVNVQYKLTLMILINSMI